MSAVVKAHPGTGAGGYLLPATSNDGLTWTGSTTRLPLDSATGAWDVGTLNKYRSAITAHEDGLRFRIWYAVKTTLWERGYTAVPRSLWPTPA